MCLNIRVLTFMWIIMWFGVSGLNAIDTDTERVVKNVFHFAFSGSEYVCDDEYVGNESEWKRLISYYNSLSELLDADGYYFLIESPIYNNVYTSELAALNQATSWGSLIRLRLRSCLRVSSRQIAFYINRNKNFGNQVRVTLVRQPVPADANKDIYYSLSCSRSDIAAALSRYEEIPYYDLAYYEERERLPQQSAQTVIEQQQLAEDQLVNQQVQVAVEQQQLAAEQPTRARYAVAAPFNLAIKTNVIPWLGVVSDWSLSGENASGYATGAMMYNGALEYYFASRYSLEASFLYSYASFGGRSDNLWGISQLSVEPRYWVISDGTFRSVNAGLRLGYGDFDMRNNKPEKQGKTGRFYSAALTVGYTQPVFRHWLLEGRAWVGYRNVYDGKTYRVDEGDRKNYLEKGFAEGQWIVGVEVCLGFRLGFW